MSQERHWIVKAVALAMVALGGAVVMTAVDVSMAPYVAAPGGWGVGEASQACETDTAAEVIHALECGPADDAVEPAAICRLIPECWKNSDCDARCGAGLGKCVHSNCPPRVCRCR